MFYGDEGKKAETPQRTRYLLDNGCRLVGRYDTACSQVAEDRLQHGQVRVLSTLEESIRQGLTRITAQARVVTPQRPRMFKKHAKEWETYPEVGKLEPDNEDGLEGEIPRDVVKDSAKGEALEEVEGTEDGPVGQSTLR